MESKGTVGLVKALNRLPEKYLDKVTSIIWCNKCDKHSAFWTATDICPRCSSKNVEMLEEWHDDE